MNDSSRRDPVATDRVPQPNSTPPLSARFKGARTFSKCLPAFAIVVGFALATCPLDAEESGIQQGIFIDTVDVHLVNIEVVATRKDGTSVTGLKIDDFQVFEDGELVEISNFYAVESGSAVQETGTEANEPSGAQTGSEPSPELAAALKIVSEPQPLNLVILVDNARIRPPIRNRVFNGLQEHLDRLLRPGDRVAVVGHDRSVHFAQTFTTDRTLVDSALEELRKKGVASRTMGEYRRLLLAIETATPVGGAGLSKADPALEAQTILTSIRQYSQRTEDHVEQTVRVLDSLLGSISGLPGRKAVFYLTDGLELRPGEGLFNVWWDKYSIIANQVSASPPEVEVLRFDGTSALQDLVASASSSGVAFYTLGENPSFDSLSAEVGRITSSTSLRSERLSQQESLVTLAQATGGYSLTSGSGGVDTLLDRLAQDFQNYYSLAYVSPNHGDGKAHRIRVEARENDIRLRYLERYRDKSTDERMIDRTTSALLLDIADNPMEIRLEIGKAKREKNDQYLLPILVRIPIGKLALLPSGDQHSGRVSIYLVVRDTEGRLSEPHQAPLPIEIPNDQLIEAVASSAGYATQLRVRSGEQKIAVGVRDEVGATSSSVNLVVDVGNGS